MPPRAQHRNLLLRKHFRGWTVRGCLIATGLVRIQQLHRDHAPARRWPVPGRDVLLGGLCRFVVVLFAQLHVFDAAARFLHLVKFLPPTNALTYQSQLPPGRRRSLRAHWSATPGPQAPSLREGRSRTRTPTTRPRVLDRGRPPEFFGACTLTRADAIRTTAVRPDCPARGAISTSLRPHSGRAAPSSNSRPSKGFLTQHFQRGWVSTVTRPVVRGPHHKQSVIETLILDIFKYVGTAV